MESRRVKILVIDDNQDNLISIKALIREAFSDALILTALTGTNGIELAVTEDPDVILLDIVMPFMDGFEVCKKLKTDKKLYEIPVVFVTAIKDDKESRIKVLECGAEAFLSKPIDEYELTAQIRAIVKIKTANVEKHAEKERLATLVTERTLELNANHTATLNLLEDLRKENEARRKSEEALRASEDKFKYIFDYSPDGKSITLTTGEINVNKAFCNMLGYTQEELQQTKWQEITYPDDIELTQRAIDSLLSTEQESVRFVKRFIHKSGAIVWVDLHSSLRLDKDNKPLYLMSNISDITKRIQADERLRENEMKLRSTFDQSPVGSVIVGLDKCFIKCNSAFCHFLGYSEDELIGKTIAYVTWPEDNELGMLDLKLMIQGKKDSSTLQKRYLRKDGSIVWGEITISLERDSENKPMFFLSIIQNITERKQAEEKLKKSYDLLNKLSAQVPGVVYQYRLYPDGSSAFPYSSPGMYDVYEVKPEEVREDASPVFTRIHPDDYDNIVETINESARSQTLYHSEFRVILPKQGLRWRMCDAKPERLEDGSTLWYGIITDITERKHSELLLRVINKELIQTNEELITAKEHAEESDRLKSAFLANMSHEIRTPMNGILGFAGLLKEPNLTGEEQQEYINIIEKSGARMLNIINDIIDISKIESGLMEVHINDSNINEQIEYIYTFFKPEIERKGLHVYFNNALSAKESILKTDREKVYAVLMNLVKNAIKYIEKGSIKLGYEKKDGYLEFYVKDTGIGIPKDRQEAIFDRFVQADIGDKRAFQGAGLGLSISKAYVEMLGGKIWVESEEGKGSAFYFTIPYHCEHEVKNVIKNSVMNEATEIQVRNLKILIVEDDEVSGILIAIAVKIFGKDVLKARTGVEAVEACRNNPDIDLVLMDIKLPVMDGYEATRQIRQFNTSVVIIAETAFALTGDREKSIAVGCNDYISKPFDRAKLAVLIEKHFKNRKSNKIGIGT
ncbi:MAG: PAS domain S-box protein [Bacteroidia bacterium]|nr:PAS domain S-box protein [Bacteroidia bacterium]